MNPISINKIPSYIPQTFQNSNSAGDYFWSHQNLFQIFSFDETRSVDLNTNTTTYHFTVEFLDLKTNKNYLLNYKIGETLTLDPNQSWRD